MNIKLPLFAKNKIISKFEDYKVADEDFTSSSHLFRFFSFLTLCNFLVFSFGVMDPITLKQSISTYGYHFSQIFLVVGFLLTKFYLDKKNASQQLKIEISTELNRDWKLNIEKENKSYSISIAIDDSEEKWIFQKINILDSSSYDDIEKNDWLENIKKLP